MTVPANVTCACANNSVGRNHRKGESPCGLTAADTRARFWVVGVYHAWNNRTQRWDGAPYASLYASFNTVAGAQKRFRAPIPGPMGWADLDWAHQGYQLVRNPTKEA